jgi:hypothetical protein
MNHVETLEAAAKTYKAAEMKQLDASYKEAALKRELSRYKSSDWKEANKTCLDVRIKATSLANEAFDTKNGAMVFASILDGDYTAYQNLKTLSGLPVVVEKTISDGRRITWNNKTVEIYPAPVYYRGDWDREDNDSYTQLGNKWKLQGDIDSFIVAIKAEYKKVINTLTTN